MSDLQAKFDQLRTTKTYENSFEWRFEFPEVWNDEGDFVGFDLIIGNPPYIQLQENEGFLAKQLKDSKYETFARSGDIYCLFYERGIQLLRIGGIEAFITSSKWMKATYGAKIREFFTKKNPLKLINLGAGVFESATVDTNILIIGNDVNANQLETAVFNDTRRDFSTLRFAQSSFSGSDTWTILPHGEQAIKHKIESIGTPLKDWDIDINYGVKTGFNEAFIISTSQREQILSKCLDEEERVRTEKIIKPMLRGRDIKRYYASWAGMWLINTHNGLRSQNIAPILISNYPALKSHLDQYYPQLQKRLDKGVTPYNLRNCAYLKELEQEKIVWIEICDKSQFHLDNGDYSNEATSFMMCSKSENLRYLIALLNSKVINYVLTYTTASTGVGTSRWKKVYVQQFPIPRISPEGQQPYIDRVNRILDKKRENPGADTSALEAEIDQMVYTLYNLTPDEINLIENK